jgi:LmbE family N-acetylglucosaminyl deacetylase
MTQRTFGQPATPRSNSEIQPQRVLIQSPERRYDRIQASHPDHLAAGEAAIRAIYPAAENLFAWPELVEQGLEPWHVSEVWIMAHPQMTHAVDITDTFDRKLNALHAHASQTGHMIDQLEGFLRGWGNGVAEMFGLGQGRLGECFHIMDLG